MEIPINCPYCNGYKTVISCINLFDKWVYCYNCKSYFTINEEVEVEITDNTMPKWMQDKINKNKI